MANQILNEMKEHIKHSLKQTGTKEEPGDVIDNAMSQCNLF